ncbi:hypothetical protein DBR40_19875 [Pedobacter sp. KBW01]|uniref:hypothetical protein n=1 Tax=Pedobacter sp. KBW01 TaxID=2153364 RepID=UPI000F5ABC61|nr:hypothetical protein [Pedobacter sp. KBW01]RQO68502.1 hypothetical protein DBR40_19875 [Pedobacter sp. KBW01]
MKIKRIFADGTSDFITAKTIDSAKNRQVKKGKELKALHIIDIVSGVVLALINVIKAIKN